MPPQPPDGDLGHSQRTDALEDQGVDRASGERAQRIAVVVHHPGGAEISLIDARHPVTVGRDAPSTIRIPDRKLSREHARFSWQDSCALVEDLGSTNGTWLRGARVSRATLEIGDEVVLGRVIARIHALEAPGSPPLIDEGIRRQIDDEVARARHTRRSFALLAVCEPRDPRSGAPVIEWAAAVRASLRPFDRLGVHSSDMALILLPETGAEVAADMARAIAGPRRRVGIARFPDAATTGERLIDLASRALARASAAQPVEQAPIATWVESPATSPAMITSAATRALFDTVQRVAAARGPVILHGETGTGKEVVARLIHDQGPRRAQRMVRVNCGAIPAQLVESTLFGHEKGAFSGAVQQQKGVFEDADRGTVLLDEIGELPVAAQAALLRVLETGSFSRVGSTREITADVRVVAATHRDLRAMVAAGRFREDLYYRLDAITLTIPPLRERTDEIEPLAMMFLGQSNAANGRELRGIDRDALARLRSYAWPGNIRELRNAIERAVMVARGDLITEEDLPTRLRDAASAPAPPATHPAGPEARARIQQYEAQLIAEALQAAGGSRAEAARRLGMPLRTLAYKIKTLGVPESKR